MNYGLRISSIADDDVDNAAAYIAGDRLDAALRFCEAVGATYRQIMENPNRWRRYEHNRSELGELRVCPVKGYSSFLIFYRIDADMVEILRVIHGARDIPALFGSEDMPGAE